MPRLRVPLLSKTYRTRSLARILGKLKGFMDLPMDVVFEVSLHTCIHIVPSLSKKCGYNKHFHFLFQTAMYLAPNDLLQLSRLSKQFRSIFASRSSIFVWQTVLRNADLICFKDLNEMQFASLLYDKCCMVTFLFIFFRINHSFFKNVPFRHADISRGNARYFPSFV